MTSKLLLAAGAALLCCGASQAIPVFSDDFERALVAQDGTPVGWRVIEGSVQVIGGKRFNDLLANDGHFVDLDGRTGNGGRMLHRELLQAGVTYSASFDLAGNFRQGGDEQVRVRFGSTVMVYTLGEWDPFETFTLSFTPRVDGRHVLSFANAGGDKHGALLDNVVIARATDDAGTAVPEPHSLALVALALTGMGVFSRRRRPAIDKAIRAQAAIFSRQ